MNMARFVSRVSKPLWCSLSRRGAPLVGAPLVWAPIVGVPCNAISTGKDHAKFGNVGGKTKADPTRPLDIYLGRWIYDPRQALQQQGQIQEQDRIQQEMLRELNIKNYIHYTRNNGTWKVEQGFVGAGKTMSYEFVLGEMFLMLYPDNNYVKTLIYNDGQRMTWAFYPVDAPDEVLRVETEIKDNKLYWRTEYPDGLQTCRIYVRD